MLLLEQLQDPEGLSRSRLFRRSEEIPRRRDYLDIIRSFRRTTKVARGILILFSGHVPMVFCHLFGCLPGMGVSLSPLSTRISGAEPVSSLTVVSGDISAMLRESRMVRMFEERRPVESRFTPNMSTCTSM